MAVYVDDMHTTPLGQFGRMKMCHMVADTTDELLAMANKIGVQRKWMQHVGSPKEHFDISLSKRAVAVAAGAIEIRMADAGRIVRAKREELAKRGAK